MHDGRVTAAASSFDDSCIISAAADGTLLLLSNPLAANSGPPAPAQANMSLPTISQDSAGWPEAADISATSPTLEEAKQSAQRNMQAAAAAAAREQLVAAVDSMRREYAALMAENEARRQGEQVPQHMLELDAGVLSEPAALRSLLRGVDQARLEYCSMMYIYTAWAESTASTVYDTSTGNSMRQLPVY
eukprot:GHUV01019931.1.p1 GENE.GHUV01019931.1~~GHUV01019931.1.p1  ORF type:complete len:189 (+),score=57.35 GHUV01019931.1:1925-2491(+)